jgi:hypothetical protein
MEADGAMTALPGINATMPSMPRPISPGDAAGASGSADTLKREFERYVLWIDGVGAYLVCLGERVSIGGPQGEREFADVALLANLSRCHATFVRSGEGYVIEAHGLTTVAGRPVEGRTLLSDGYTVELAGSVRLRFRQPTVLSPTATIEFESSHRPVRRIDGIVLMDGTCMLGPGRENHIVCADWDRSVLLYRKENGFWCKASGDVFMDGQAHTGGGAFSAGQVVSGLDFRFRLEPASWECRMPKPE